MKTLAHKLVAKTAREAAGELYELLMSNNELRAEWIRQNPGLGPKALESRFIEKNAAACIPFARATLATMLTLPTLAESTKECILEALALDAQVPGRIPRARARQFLRGQS